METLNPNCPDQTLFLPFTCYEPWELAKLLSLTFPIWKVGIIQVSILEGCYEN